MGDHAYLRMILQKAVEDAIDVKEPVGLVLSGGIDSSTVTAFADRVCDSYGWPFLPTFTGYYEVAGYDERRYARLVGKGQHHEIKITPEDFVEHFDDMVAAIEPPYQGMGTFGQYMVARYISRETGVAVLLSGEGSDELFGGYARLMKVAGWKLPDGYEDYEVPHDYPTTLEGALRYDEERLPNLLAVDDQCMSAFGLQAVAPFCDERVVAYAHGLPATQRIAKQHLRETVAGIVPRQIIDRTDKMGFPVPLVTWAQEDPVRSFVMDRIAYLPEPNEPWDRGFWYDLIDVANGIRATREVPA